MPRLTIRRMVVLLIAVFVTAGMDLPAVQASGMSGKMMDMAASMAASMGASMGGHCHECGDSKGMAACVAAGCVAVAALPRSLEIPAASARPVHRLHPGLALFGRDSVPDPYPPRTSDIG
jgi:hypothetical protein